MEDSAYMVKMPMKSVDVLWTPVFSRSGDLSEFTCSFPSVCHATHMAIRHGKICFSPWHGTFQGRSLDCYCPSFTSSGLWVLWLLLSSMCCLVLGAVITLLLHVLLGPSLPWLKLEPKLIPKEAIFSRLSPLKTRKIQAGELFKRPRLF